MTGESTQDKHLCLFIMKPRVITLVYQKKEKERKVAKWNKTFVFMISNYSTIKKNRFNILNF